MIMLNVSKYNHLLLGLVFMLLPSILNAQVHVALVDTTDQKTIVAKEEVKPVVKTTNENP